ncbi:cellulase family glycosylhydrolase [Candidatus Dojkabacteria bacterium]|nr:cellulase family glycosylhydrolase [Candidatus Dojkabacteria bacterium]
MKQKIRGVNLGGWLVLEKWITPSLFEGTTAQDELNLHKVQFKDKIINHYQSFITEDDFRFLSENSINTLRIPVGYWLFGDYPPFIENINYLDFAFKYANKYNLNILIDLHAAPGSQNGYDHSGVVGNVNWDKDAKYIYQTLNILDRISKRYCKNKSLFGISLLNEPHKNIPIKLLENFYIQGYKTVRNHCNESVAVIISDSFRPIKFSKLLQDSVFKNVILDSHFYQCFYEGNKRLNMNQIIKNTKSEWKKIIDDVQKYKPLLCGEWSLGIDPMSLSKLSPENKISAIKEFGRTQMDIFENSIGWFFWTYKTESDDGWNFKKRLEDKTIIINVDK